MVEQGYLVGIRLFDCTVIALHGAAIGGAASGCASIGWVRNFRVLSKQTRNIVVFVRVRFLKNGFSKMCGDFGFYLLYI